jgi:hypothetical protein
MWCTERGALEGVRGVVSYRGALYEVPCKGVQGGSPGVVSLMGFPGEGALTFLLEGVARSGYSRRYTLEMVS